ncbi:MAG: HAMP domain-containing histidine kinase [Chlorobi bacterium]|nr:HAMP domain-containing histidine kinase [Chlorobiota bacterium]
MEHTRLAQQQSAATHQARSPGATRIRVLVADADPIVRDAVELYSNATPGLEAIAAASPAEASKLLASESFDAIVLDANFDDAETIFRRLPSEAMPAVVLLVPLTEPDAVERCATVEYQLVLTKPIYMPALHRAIALCVRCRWLDKQLRTEQHHEQARRELARQLDLFAEQIRQLERKLADSDRRFRLAIHDLQNPLSNVYALLNDLNQRREQLPPLAQEAIALCLQSVETMRALVEDLLSASQLDHEQALTYRSIEVAPLLRAVARSFAAAAERKNIWINVLVPDTLPPLRADEFKLRTALDNLVSNAIKYTPPGGSVNLEAELCGSTMILRVRDTGVGLSADDIAAAFQEFGRLSSVPTGGEPSTGLGLYIVRRIAELHGGSVSASSEGKGRGATFTIELPLESPRPSDSGTVQ